MQKLLIDMSMLTIQPSSFDNTNCDSSHSPLFDGNTGVVTERALGDRNIEAQASPRREPELTAVAPVAFV
jgi:hypothetical protein